MKKLRDDCFLHDKDRLRHEEALDILRERLSPVAGKETVSLENASERILADEIRAVRNIPFTDNSAVDGYAFAFADHEPTGGYFPVVARIAAGNHEDIELPGFSAACIFTGAPMPTGSDTVAMQEDCEVHEQDGSQFVIIPKGLKRGANCRKAGEDVSKGEIVASAGCPLRPQDLAAIASSGIVEVSVFRKLKIGLVSSGDELLRPGEAHRRGSVYDANHFMIRSLLAHLPVEIEDLGIWRDDALVVRDGLGNAANRFDVIIATGGASRGGEDHFVDALGHLGKCHLWQLAVKPGRPAGFGQIGQTPCFLLPGNPVAAFVCSLMYVRPSLLVLAGCHWQEPARYRLTAGFALSSKPDRREFLRGFIETDRDGKTIVRKFSRDGSGLISGLQQSSGLIEISEETTEVSEGDPVAFIPYPEFGIRSG